jgi:protein-tyrosine phosphatase
MADPGPGPIKGSYWVQERLAAGEYPGGWSERTLRARLRGLLEAGVTLFVDLTERGEKGLQPYDTILRQEAGSKGRVVQYVRFPIPDFDTPTVSQMRHILDLIDRSLSEDYAIYLHCYAGIGRTGTVVGCFLVRHGWSGQVALDEIVNLRRWVDPEKRPSPITAEQRGMVLEWAALDPKAR